MVIMRQAFTKKSFQKPWKEIKDNTGIPVSWFPAFDWNVSVRSWTTWSIPVWCFLTYWNWMLPQEILNMPEDSSFWDHHFGSWGENQWHKMCVSSDFFLYSIEGKMKPTGKGEITTIWVKHVRTTRMHSCTQMIYELCLVKRTASWRSPCLSACHCRPTKGIPQPLR